MPCFNSGRDGDDPRSSSNHFKSRSGRRGSIFREEERVEGVEHELGGEHDVGEIAATTPSGDTAFVSVPCDLRTAQEVTLHGSKIKGQTSRAESDAGNRDSVDACNRLVKTGEHTYRIPDGEKCIVRVGDKTRIIHGPAILNFASSDGLMTSVMGDVAKLSQHCFESNVNMSPPSESDRALIAAPPMSSTPPSRRDLDTSGTQLSDHHTAEDSSSFSSPEGNRSIEVKGDGSVDLDVDADIFESSLEKPTNKGDFYPLRLIEKDKKDKEEEGRDGHHSLLERRDQHNRTNSEEEEIMFDHSAHIQSQSSSANQRPASVSVFLHSSSTPDDDLDLDHAQRADMSCLLHVEIQPDTQLPLDRTSSRHVSPCSENSQDSSYSSSSFSSKSPPLTQHTHSDDHTHSPTEAMSGSGSGAGNNRRQKRKVKLVPYQDTTGPEYIEKLRAALSSVGTPRLDQIEARCAKVCWDVCKSSLFPLTAKTASSVSQSSSALVTSSQLTITERVSYTICWGKGTEEKASQLCGNSSSCTLEPLVPGGHYELFVFASVDDVRGLNSAIVSFSAKSLPPDCPHTPTLKQATKSSLLVTWPPPPTDNGAKITCYRLYAVEESRSLEVESSAVEPTGGSSGGEGNSSSTCLKYEGCQRSAKLDHLQPNTNYKMRLVSCNSQGPSAPSAEVVFATLPTQPPQPDPPTLVYRDPHNIRLSWSSYLAKHLKSLSKQHIDFTLQMEDEQSPLQHGFITQYSGPDTCYTVSNLPRTSSFLFKLYAETAFARSAPSEVVSFSTTNSVPRAPTGLRCTDVTSNRCTLRWEKPSDDGGSAVLEYIVERSISGGGFQEIYHGEDVSLPISSLFPGMEYHFRVAAVNAIGKGKFSNSCPCHTKPVVPAQCNPPTVTGRIKTHSVHLSWVAPDYDGGSPVLEYAVKQIPNIEQPEVGHEISRDHRQDLIVFELVPGTVYGFSVCATNSVGSGPWSTPLKVRTASDKPCAPDAPRVVFKSPTHAKISWTAPKSDNGSRIIEYRLECLELNSHASINKYEAYIEDDPDKSENGAAGVSTSHASYLSSCSFNNSSSSSTSASASSAAYLSSSLPAKSTHGGTPAAVPYPSKYSLSFSSTGSRHNPHIPRLSQTPSANNNHQFSRNASSPAATPPFFQLYHGAKLQYDYKTMKPATEYVFRVQAVNEIGASQFSCHTQISSPCSVPNTVRNLSTDVTADSIFLSWEEPDCNGSPILSYSIECACLKRSSKSDNHHLFTDAVLAANVSRSNSPKRSPASSEHRNSITFPDEKTADVSVHVSETNSITVTQVRPDTHYKLRVQAVNENGSGVFSVPVKVRTLSLPPDPPQLECVNATSTSLKLRWTDVASSKEVKYHLQMEDRSGRFMNTYSGPAVSYKVIRLQELTSYTFRINASNDAGCGCFSQLYCFTTSKSAPLPMKAPKVRLCKDGELEVSWSASGSEYHEDKLVYQLMMSATPSLNDFIIAYKGENLECSLDHLLSCSDMGVVDVRLKVCAIRQCVDDNQELFGQYSPLTSFQYPLSSIAHPSTAGQASLSSAFLRNVRLSPDVSLGSLSVDQSERLHLTPSSKFSLATTVANKICKSTRELMLFRPSDNQIAIMALAVFVLMMAVLALYLQQVVAESI